MTPGPPDTMTVPVMCLTMTGRIKASAATASEHARLAASSHLYGA